MRASLVSDLRGQLRRRRDALTRTISEVGEAGELVRLLGEVDGALERVGTDGFGRCQMCGDPFDDDELLAQPMKQYCLCRLTAQQKAELERDLDLAWRVQVSLLPNEILSHGDWMVHYRYRPAGPISGDYCDVVTNGANGRWMYFLVGDVAGKGVAAAYMAAYLSALVRTILETPIPVADVVEKLNGYVSERTPSTHFITLICGRADATGHVEICNAGHCPPMVVRRAGVLPVDSTGFPLGVDHGDAYDTYSLDLASGESLVLYTDGITEALDSSQTTYGENALRRVLAANRAAAPVNLADACLRDLQSFRNGAPRTDDLTLMVVRRGGSPETSGTQ
ncbi:MAG: SpoIIE family protein phosphatase [Phycisphaerales bacterium]|nr:MAG: SpoIIE family protein phosphatase [Phycisphaerales bacterium]